VSLNHISPWIGGGDNGGEANNVAANTNTTATSQQTVPGENFSCHVFQLPWSFTTFSVVIVFLVVVKFCGKRTLPLLQVYVAESLARQFINILEFLGMAC
jgi:hypothetical protein